MRKLLLLLLMVAASFCLGKAELGALQGVPFRIDVPETWNQSLVVYYHGYSPGPVRFKQGQLDATLAEFTTRSYAVVQSPYSRTGWERDSMNRFGGCMSLP